MDIQPSLSLRESEEIRKMNISCRVGLDNCMGTLAVTGVRSQVGGLLSLPPRSEPLHTKDIKSQAGLIANCMEGPGFLSFPPHEQEWTKWHSGLKHYIAVLEALLQTRVHSRAVPQPAVAGSHVGRRTIGPASYG